MAIKGDFLVKTTQKELVLLAFRLALDGTNNPAVTEGTEFIASAVHTSTGLYTVTLREKFVAASGITVTVEAATAVDLKPQLGAVAKNAKVFTVRLLASLTTLTDPAAKGTNATYLHGHLAVRSV